MGKLLGVVNNFLHRSSTSPTIFHRNVSFEIKITLPHYEIFLFFFFFILQKHARNPMKNNEHRKECPPHPRKPLPYISIFQD